MESWKHQEIQVIHQKISEWGGYAQFDAVRQITVGPEI